MLQQLLSKKAQQNLGGTSTAELLNESFITSCKHLSNSDRLKLLTIRESYHLYSKEQAIGQIINSSNTAIEYIRGWIGLESTERMVALLLSAQGEILDAIEVFKGSATKSVCHPREIFRAAVKYPTATIILGHNHPSGSLKPSSADIAATENMVNAGYIMDIPIIDHIIVGKTGGVSIRETHPYVWD